jgi:hypothetical protein
MERLHGPKVARVTSGASLSKEEKVKRRAEALEERERYRREDTNPSRDGRPEKDVRHSNGDRVRMVSQHRDIAR